MIELHVTIKFKLWLLFSPIIMIHFSNNYLVKVNLVSFYKIPRTCILLALALALVIEPL